MVKYTEQINVKVPFRLRREIALIERFEGAGASELIRTWIREKIKEYYHRRDFLRWKAKELTKDDDIPMGNSKRRKRRR